MSDAIQGRVHDRAAKPGTLNFGLLRGPSGYTEDESAAWSGGYWAARRDRACPFREGDPRSDAWWRGRAAGQSHV